MKIFKDINRAHSWSFLLRSGLLIILFIILNTGTSYQFHNPGEERGGAAYFKNSWSDIQVIITGNLSPESGNDFQLTCNIENGFDGEYPAHVYWYHNNILLTYAPPEGVSIHTDRVSDSTISTLKIKNAQAIHSGRYTCKGSNTDPTSVTVHVS